MNPKEHSPGDPKEHANNKRPSNHSQSEPANCDTHELGDPKAPPKEDEGNVIPGANAGSAAPCSGFRRGALAEDPPSFVRSRTEKPLGFGAGVQGSFASVWRGGLRLVGGPAQFGSCRPAQVSFTVGPS